ncbi:MAG: ATP-binding cassette domain-containing protein [bacterium]|nr:ATP-binding cassette domain-containing protein [bacterium]
MSAVLECRAVRKVFQTYERAPGLKGILSNFFSRESIDVVALESIDLEVAAGEFVGLIGPNGAGKTTLVKAVTGILPVTSGSATLFGCDTFHLADEHKRRLSVVMGQRSQLWWDLPPLDSFRLLREIYEVPQERFGKRLADYAEMLDVEDQLKIQLRLLSLGQRMKMEIIGAFLHDPEVVFLDEPTIGLDLVSREVIRRFLVELNREHGATMVLTSHDMEDIEDTCQRLVILEGGSVRFDGDLVELHHRVVGRRAVEIHLEPGTRAWSESLAAELAPYRAELVKHTPGALTFVVEAPRTQAFVKHLFDLFEVRDVAVERQPLEHLIKEIYSSREAEASG